MNARRIGQFWMLFVLPLSIGAGCTSTITDGEDEEQDVSQQLEDDPGSDKGAPPAGGGDPGDASGTVCTGSLVGDGSICIGPAEIDALASAACSSQGLGLAEIHFTDDCADGGTTAAKVVCCGPGDPGDPGDPNGPEKPSDPGSTEDPGASLFGHLGDGETCVENATYLQLATAACAAAGLVLHDLATTNDCPPDASRWAKYLCLE